ncbi:MAG: porin family protein [Epsilonproteobacteria bacterium]|nr:porin family protein [Campylobacterota bacterium]
MKRILSGFLLSCSLLTHAYAESYIDYVSVGVAMQTLQDPDIDLNLEDEKGVAVVLNAGKMLYSDIALEFEGSASITKPEWKLGEETYEVDFWSLGLYGAYIWRINNLSIKPRLGLVYENIKSTINAAQKPNDTEDIALSGGIGFSYQFTENYALYTNYTKFEDDINHLTFGAEYKF